MRSKREFEKRLSMHNFAMDGGDIYFSALNVNGLYRLRLAERRLQFLGCIPGEDVLGEHLFGAVAVARGKVYMSPMNGGEIAVYDIEKRTFGKIPLAGANPEMKSRFYGAAADGSTVLFIPCRYPSLAVLDTEKARLVRVGEWDRHPDLRDKDNGMLVKNGYFIRRGKLYMASFADNLLIKVSLEDYAVETERIDGADEGFMDMCEDEDGESIWFVQKCRPVVIRWNEREKSSRVYDKLPRGFQAGTYPFINIVRCGDRLSAVAYQANMSLEIDADTGEAREAGWDLPREDMGFNRWKARHYFAKKMSENSFVTANTADHSFYLVEDGELREVFFLNDETGWMGRFFSGHSYLREAEQCSLETYLRFVEGSVATGGGTKKERQCGQEIHERIMREVEKNS